MKNLMSLIAMLLVIVAMEAKSHDCLPVKLKHVKISKKYNVLTVKGRNYNEAEKQLHLKMPKAGFLQEIKHKEVQKLNLKNYSRQVTLSKSLKASTDLWLKYSCQYRGNYYITSVIPVEGIKYFDYWYPKDWTLTNIKRWCGPHKKIVLLATQRWNDFVYTADRAFKYKHEGKRKKCKQTYCNFHVLCGNVKVRLGMRDKGGYETYISEISNDFESFVAIGSHDGWQQPEVKDLTIDFWLELTKGI